jgi:hypothetical protein
MGRFYNHIITTNLSYIFKKHLRGVLTDLKEKTGKRDFLKIGLGFKKDSKELHYIGVGYKSQSGS